MIFYSKVQMGDESDKHLNLFLMRRIINENHGSFLDIRGIDLFFS